MQIRRSTAYRAVFLVMALSVCGVADARRGDPPKSTTLKAVAINEIRVLELEAVDRAALFAEDEARAADRVHLSNGRIPGPRPGRTPRAPRAG